MSELQARHIVDAFDAYTAEPWEEQSQVYLKSEADKVIAEKDKKIAELIEKNKRLARKDIIMASNAIKDVYKELRHQKYKWCLAMAMWCGATALFYGKAIPKVLNMDISDHRRQKVFRRLRHYEKWHKRWLKLA